MTNDEFSRTYVVGHKTNNGQKAMKCYICKVGETSPGHAPLVFDKGGQLVVIRDVPGEVCDTCGHLYMDAAVAIDLQRKTRKALDAETETAILHYMAA